MATTYYSKTLIVWFVPEWPTTGGGWLWGTVFRHQTRLCQRGWSVHTVNPSALSLAFRRGFCLFAISRQLQELCGTIQTFHTSVCCGHGVIVPTTGMPHFPLCFEALFSNGHGFQQCETSQELNSWKSKWVAGLIMFTHTCLQSP